MVSTVAPDVVPILPREKNYTSSKPAPKGGKPLMMLLVVVAIGLLSAIGLWRASHDAAAARQRVQVVAAGRDTPAGVRFGFTTVHYIDIPKHYLTPDMVTSPADIAGRMARTFIPMGEPITTTMLFSKQDALSLALETHERAITLELTDDALVDHSISPGDCVDVLAVSSIEGKKYTKTICQDVRVLMSVSKEQLLARHNNSVGQNKITLAVTPELTEVLTEASEVGKIRLVLRNRLTHIQPNLHGVVPSDLLPADALRKEVELPNSKAEPITVVPPPQPQWELPSSLLPTPPVLSSQPEPRGPIQWIVEVVSGSHKETYSVPKQ